MCSVIIGFIRVMYPHNVDRLADHLVKAISDMDPSLLSCVWAINSDNETTNPAMVTIAKLLLAIQLSLHEANLLASDATNDHFDPSLVVFDRQECEEHIYLIRCFAYTIQLAIKVGLNACPTIDSAIGRMRDIIKKICDSPKLIELIQNVCSTLKVGLGLRLGLGSEGAHVVQSQSFYVP